MPTVYRSSDAGAPALTGQAGSLIGVLDACLVNGYTGKAAAGWSKPFSGTNAAVYQPAAGYPLDVSDTAAQEANVRGYESLTAVGTGTNPFPTVAQRAAPGEYIRKSVTADATPRGWVLFADGTTFYLFVLTGDNAGRYEAYAFGRFYSFKAGDPHRSIISAGVAAGFQGLGLGAASLSTSATTSASGVFVARKADATVGATPAGLLGMGGTLYGSPFVGPNPNDGLIYVNRLFLSDALVNAGLRGYLRGVYQIVTGGNLNDGDTFTGTGDFAGRTFVVVKVTSGTGTSVAVETSAWDSSS